MIESMHNTDADILKSKEMQEKSKVKQETKASLSGLKKELLNVPAKIDLREKPISLGYEKINKERKLTINLPDQFSAQGRILRCMRRKSATDAVEDKYQIPRGLLLAMMAQEGMGDPTMPNLGGDGGLGLIHIQAINAAEFGLKTLPRYTNGMRDFKHGKEIKKTLKNNNYNVSKLISYDDRFHPIMGIDCAARFLKDKYNDTAPGKDRRINTLKRYSGRNNLNEYVWPVTKYWMLINTYTGDKLPDFSQSTNKELINMKNSGIVTIAGVKVPLDIVQKSVQKLSITIDGVSATYDQYLAYNAGQLQNYGLKKYILAKPKTFAKNIDPKKMEEGIENLKYLKISKNGERYVYKYTFSSLNEYATNMNTFLQAAHLYKKFEKKVVKFTDMDGSALTPLEYPQQPGDFIYIKEKIVK